MKEEKSLQSYYNKKPSDCSTMNSDIAPLYLILEVTE